MSADGKLFISTVPSDGSLYTTGSSSMGSPGVDPELRGVTAVVQKQLAEFAKLHNQAYQGQQETINSLRRDISALNRALKVKGAEVDEALIQLRRQSPSEESEEKIGMRNLARQEIKVVQEGQKNLRKDLTALEQTVSQQGEILGIVDEACGQLQQTDKEREKQISDLYSRVENVSSLYTSLKSSIASLFLAQKRTDANLVQLQQEVINPMQNGGRTKKGKS